MASATASNSTSTSTSATSAFDISSVPSKRFIGHKSKVRALAWNADGKRLASGGKDKTVRLWLPEKDSKDHIELKGHTGEVSSIRWDPTNLERLASCSAANGVSEVDRGVYFWDLRMNKPTNIVETSGRNITMTWSPDGKTIVVGNRDDQICWIDVESKTVRRDYKQVGEANEAQFTNDGSILGTAIDGNIEFRTFPDSKLVHSLAVSPLAVGTFEFDPRGRYLAAGANDSMLTLWDTTEWICVQSMGFHDTPVRSCRFSHDGINVASYCSKEIIISEVSTGEIRARIPTGGTCDALAWHPGKHLLAFAGEEGGGFTVWGLGEKEREVSTAAVVPKRPIR